MVCSAVALGLAPPCFAQAPGESPAAASQWQLESVTTSNGKVYRGLILDSSEPDSLEFVEIRRPPGKPMYLVVLPIERSTITNIERIDKEERERLRQRIEHFKAHTKIEAREMSRVRLKETATDGVPSWSYQGSWFSLDSTADEATTRLCIVRLEQVFSAFRQLLPPAGSSSATPIHFQVFGSTNQYRRFLQKQGLPIRNPAYYDTAKNWIVAGSDSLSITQHLERWRSERDKQRAELDRIDRQMPQRLKSLRERLERQGFTAKERRKIESATRDRWKREKEAARHELEIAERRNLAIASGVIDQMLRRLYHEAFHAYLENNVYHPAGHDVPRWLNEGLAQVFESGLLEDRSLRVDAPPAALLERLQEDLQSESPLSVVDVLTADQDAFLVSHAQPDATALRRYLYSWGLAHYLTFDMRVLGTAALDEYLSRDAATLEPRERFERLVGMPLDQFEDQWRSAMLSLSVVPNQTDAAQGDHGSGDASGSLGEEPASGFGSRVDGAQ